MNRWIRLAFLLAGGALFAALLSRIDFPEVRQSLARADARWLAAALVFLGSNVIVKALRWRLMVFRLTQTRLDLPSAVTAILAGVAAASFSPARTVDLAKPLLLKQRLGVGLAKSTAAVLVERFLDGAALVVLLGASLAWLPIAEGPQLRAVLAAAGLLVVAGVVALASPETLRTVLTAVIRRLPLSLEIRNGSTRLTDAFAESLSLWRSRRNLWPLLGLSVVAAFCEAARLAAVFAAMGEPLGLPGAMLAFGVANLVAVVALIPGGIGITEVSMAGMAALILQTPATGGAVAGAVLLDRLFSYYLIVGIGSLVLAALSRITRAPAMRTRPDA